MKKKTRLFGKLCSRQTVDMEKELNRLRRLVYRDALTGLFNWRAFREDLDLFMRSRRPFKLIYLDLDRFKQVNDRYGHLTGDRLLGEVAVALETVAAQSHAYRIGGDEFALIVFSTETADELHKRILSELERLTPLITGDLQVSASIGGARFPEDGCTYAALIGVADRRMYVEKDRRREQFDAAEGVAECV